MCVLVGWLAVWQYNHFSALGIEPDMSAGSPSHLSLTAHISTAEATVCVRRVARACVQW